MAEGNYIPEISRDFFPIVFSVVTSASITLSSQGRYLLFSISSDNSYAGFWYIYTLSGGGMNYKESVSASNVTIGSNGVNNLTITLPTGAMAYFLVIALNGSKFIVG